MDKIIKNWKFHIDNNPTLKIGVQILKKIEDIGFDLGIHNPQALIVGGTVRDIIIGNVADDVDISTNVDVNELEKHFNTHDIGKNKDFGIIVVNQDGEDFEIANFRSDGAYSDGRHPDSIDIVNTFEKDAQRRDFTINAMGVDKNGIIFDHFGGCVDIENKIIRTVGDPEKRFEEDFIRMLRAIRFASRIGFNIESGTWDAIKSNSSRIGSQAVERIVKEILKIAKQGGDNFADAILLLKDSGLLKFILPEVLAMEGFEHSPEHHPEGGVFDHTIAALRVSDSVDPIVNLSLLLHDVGKINTHSVGDDGIHHYFGHARESEIIVDDIANRLKLDTKSKNALKFAARNHMKIHGLLEMKTSTVMKLLSDPNWEILVLVSKADSVCRGESFDEQEWLDVENKIVQLKEKFKGKQAIDKIKKVVNGHLVMDLLGLNTKTDGPKIGKIIKHTVAWILDDNISVDDIDVIENHIKQLGTEIQI